MKHRAKAAAATEKGKRGKHSKYAAKLARGRMMYGPGCCAHTTRVKARPANVEVDPGMLEALAAI